MDRDFSGFSWDHSSKKRKEKKSGGYQKQQEKKEAVISFLNDLKCSQLPEPFVTAWDNISVSCAPFKTPSLCLVGRTMKNRLMNFLESKQSQMNPIRSCLGTQKQVWPPFEAVMWPASEVANVGGLWPQTSYLPFFITRSFKSLLTLFL